MASSHCWFPKPSLSSASVFAQSIVPSLVSLVQARTPSSQSCNKQTKPCYPPQEHCQLNVICVLFLQKTLQNPPPLLPSPENMLAHTHPHPHTLADAHTHSHRKNSLQTPEGGKRQLANVPLLLISSLLPPPLCPILPLPSQIIALSSPLPSSSKINILFICWFKRFF